MTADGEATLFLDRTGTGGTSQVRPVAGPVPLEQGPHAIAITYAHRRGRYGIAWTMARDGNPPEPVSFLALSPTYRSPGASRLVFLAVAAGAAAAVGWSVAALVWLFRRTPVPTSLAIAATTAWLAPAVAWDRPGWIRGPAPYPDEWQWEYRGGATLVRLGPAVLSAMLLLAILSFLTRGELSGGASSVDQRRRARIGLLAAMCAGLLLQVSVLHLQPGGAMATLAEQTRSERYTGYFSVAAGPDSVGSILTDHAAHLSDLPLHARTHPPGPILYYRAIIAGVAAVPSVSTAFIDLLTTLQVPVRRVGAIRSFTAPVLPSAALLAGLGVALCALLTCWPIAGIAQAAGASPAAASAAAVLWVASPAPLFFAPTFDAVCTFLVACATASGGASVLASRRRTAIAHAAVAGVAAGLALFCSFGAAPMLVAGGLVVVLVATRRAWSWTRLATVLAVALLLYGCGVSGGSRGRLRCARNRRRDHADPSRPLHGAAGSRPLAAIQPAGLLDFRRMAGARLGRRAVAAARRARHGRSRA